MTYDPTPELNQLRNVVNETNPDRKTTYVVVAGLPRHPETLSFWSTTIQKAGQVVVISEDKERMMPIAQDLPEVKFLMGAPAAALLQAPDLARVDLFHINTGSEFGDLAVFSLVWEKLKLGCVIVLENAGAAGLLSMYLTSLVVPMVLDGPGVSNDPGYLAYQKT